MSKRVALVAGGSGEIGSAIAKDLAGTGMVVCVGYGSQSDRAAEVVDDIIRQGGQAEACALDVTDSVCVDERCEELYERLGSLDVLVNAAATNREAPALGMEDDDWNAVIDVNLSGAFRLCRAAGKYMILGRWGRIINVSSVSAHLGGRGQINYASAKAGLERMTEVLALELGRKGITANCIAPGVIETAMSERIRQEHRDALLASIPAQRFGTPADVVAAARFLASEEAGYINGQVLRVDGGMGK